MGKLAEEILFQSKIPEAADIMVAVVYSIFGVCSLFGNSVLLYVSYKKKHLLKPAEFFIINLAVSDMGLTLSLYPMAILSSLYHRWLFGNTFCMIYAFCGMLFGLCSLTTLTLLSIVCCIKVCYPLYGNRFNLAHGRLLVACAWVYALLFACSPLAHWGEYGPEPYGTACCIDWRVSNRHAAARSYTVVLFICCYMVPLAVIVASYTGILVTVRASRRAMERHLTSQTRMSSIQAIIVKLSVAVCIGFFSAWSPYAIVSMWAAFGRIESIPPLAFAMPAMFAKSSTIYNPIVYLLLRPNFRQVMCRDLGQLRRACLGGCWCSPGPRRPCPPRPALMITLRTLSRQPDVSSSNSLSGQRELRCSAGRGCSDAFECFRHYPKACHMALAVGTGSLRCPPHNRTAMDSPEHQKQPKLGCAKSVRVSVRGKRTAEIENLEIDLETVPGHAKVAWP